MVKPLVRKHCDGHAVNAMGHSMRILWRQGIGDTFGRVHKQMTFRNQWETPMEILAIVQHILTWLNFEDEPKGKSSSVLSSTPERGLSEMMHTIEQILINPQNIKCRCWTTMATRTQMPILRVAAWDWCNNRPLLWGLQCSVPGPLVGGMPKQKRQVKNMNMRPAAG